MRILFIWFLYSLALSIGLALKGFRSPSASARKTGEKRDAPKKILIVGATGGTGRQLVLQALERGLAVTALAREPAKLGIEHPNLRIVQGDVLDYAAVEAAVKGQEAVVSALGHKRYFGPSRILSEGTRNILRAMEAHGVRRFICQTSLGIGDSAGRMGIYYTFIVCPLVVPFYFWDKTRQERLIAESKLDWVIVRPGQLTNGEKRGAIRHGAEIGNYLFTVSISRADVAGFILNQLTDDYYLGTAVGVCW
ncbi:MAG: SDR family oxidoreductase [candidate division Zixibacteria bacterium]|nr:SDR family oxidoreductase [candidate division Zixibacteria bacterium]